MNRVISRSALWAGLSLVLIAAAISAGQSAGTMLGEAEAQALIKKFQGQPGGKAICSLVGRNTQGPKTNPLSD